MARFYDIDSANEKLKELRPLLESLREDRMELADVQRDFRELLAADGLPETDAHIPEHEARVREIVRRMERGVAQIDAWGITLRDIRSGLVDFPALVSGRQVWLCWRVDEPELGWWHEVTTGFEGRRRLRDLA